jgi:hypothetical protein
MMKVVTVEPNGSKTEREYREALAELGARVLISLRGRSSSAIFTMSSGTYNGIREEAIRLGLVDRAEVQS